MKTKSFKVGEVSAQIAQNHWAWATNIQYFQTKKAAEKYAAERWEELCDDADKAGSSFVGATIIENY